MSHTVGKNSVKKEDGGRGQHEVVDWPGSHHNKQVETVWEWKIMFSWNNNKKEINRDYLDLIEWIIKLDLVQN